MAETLTFGETWANQNIRLSNSPTFTGTRFSVSEDIVRSSKSSNTFDYQTYNKDNLPTQPMYRPIGHPIGTNFAEIEINSRLIDIARINQWMFTTGRGVKWVGEQIGLQMSNPKVEAFLNNPFSQNRVYIPAKTILSVGTAGTGVRFQRSGILGLEYDYEDVMKFNQLSESKTTLNSNNRLIKLGRELRILNSIKVDGEASAKSAITRQGKNYGNSLLGYSPTLSGIGGPNSLFGVGDTIIGFPEKTYGPFKDTDFNSQVSFSDYTYTTISEKRNDFINGDSSGNRLLNIYKNGPASNELPKAPKSFPVSTTDKGLIGLTEEDLSRQLKGIKGHQTNAPNTGPAEPAPTNQKVTSYIISTYDQLSKIAGDPSLENTVNRDSAFKDIANTYLNSLFKNNPNKNGNKDIAYYEKYSRYVDPFDQPDFADKNNDYKGIRITRLNDPSNPLNFKAFIENIADNFKPKWNDVVYVGRPDTFRIYTGLTRTISLTFLLVDFDGYSAIWNQTNQIAQYCSPSFTSDGKMVSPVLRLNVLDLFNEVGYIDDLTIGIEKEYPWDLNPKQNPEGKYDVSVKPMVASITITFQSMMDRLPSDTAIYYKTIN